MDRRLIGALLLVAVTAAGVVAAKVSGLRTVGTAIMIDLPADPRVGDCLLESTNGSLPESTTSNRTQLVPPASRAQTDPAAIGGGVFGPLFGQCAGPGPIGGEVVALLSATGDAHDRAVQAQNNSVGCRAASLQYAGLRAIDNHFGLTQQVANDPVTWRLSINLKSAWVPPSPLLQAAGRTWLACIAAPSDGALYRGRLADAFKGEQLPDEFGTCWNSHSLSAAVKTFDCATPHLAELVSFGLVPDRSLVTYAQVRSSCEQLTARVLDRADPTAGGALTVKTSPDRINPTGSDSLTVLCYVTPTADRDLDGTLVALGDKPIPFVG